MSATPASVPVDGNVKVSFLSAVADPAAVTVAEATAGTDISKYLTGDGWAPTGDQGSIVDSRLAVAQDFEQPGRKTGIGLTIRYVFNLGDPTSDAARLALTEGTQGYVILGLQKDPDTDWVADDFYELRPVTLGEQKVLPPEANAVDRIEQKVFITGPIERFNQLTA